MCLVQGCLAFVSQFPALRWSGRAVSKGKSRAETRVVGAARPNPLSFFFFEIPRILSSRPYELRVSPYEWNE